MKFKARSLKHKIPNNLILLLIFVLALLDYIFTFWGIHNLNMISELNPLMIRFMELPLNQGIFFRCMIIFIPLFMLKSVEKKFKSPKKFKLILMFILSVQIIPNFLHMIWIYNYFKLSYL